jgi:hypothetical protein
MMSQGPTRMAKQCESECYGGVDSRAAEVVTGECEWYNEEQAERRQLIQLPP